MVTENEGVKASRNIWVEIWEKLSEGGDSKALAYEASVVMSVLQTDYRNNRRDRGMTWGTSQLFPTMSSSSTDYRSTPASEYKLNLSNVADNYFNILFPFIIVDSRTLKWLPQVLGIFELNHAVMRHFAFDGRETIASTVMAATCSLGVIYSLITIQFLSRNLFSLMLSISVVCFIEELKVMKTLCNVK